MFTGIVQAVGRIGMLKPLEEGVRLTVIAGSLDLSDVQLGDSIAINGACMTVVERTDKSFKVDVSAESLNCTFGLDDVGREVNLEKALRPSDRLGGHMVTGHVDGLGSVVRFQQLGESTELVVKAPMALAKYIAAKGSIVVNGVSLTTNRISDVAGGCEFSINLIPHTLAVTALRHLQIGESVNLEIDLIARYVERMLSFDSQAR